MAEIMTDSQLKEREFDNRQNNRLSQDSKAVVRLVELFANGTVSSKSEPKAVWLSVPTFQIHKLNNFRTCFNNIRKDYLTDKISGNFTVFSVFIFLQLIKN